MRKPPEFKVAQTVAALEISGKIDSSSSELLQITVEGNRLRILQEAENGSPPFETVFNVPAGYDLSRASANCFRGVLRIIVPGKFQWN